MDIYYTFISSTNVECAGQCLLLPSCSAFRYYGNTCQLLNPTYLYRNKVDISGTSIYMEVSKWAMRGIEQFSLCNNVAIAIEFRLYNYTVAIIINQNLIDCYSG
jgi:hypothetical protein